MRHVSIVTLLCNVDCSSGLFTAAVNGDPQHCFGCDVGMLPPPQHCVGPPENRSAPKKSIGRYRMDAKPRGICVIINNYNFEKSRLPSNGDRIALKDREGSQQDQSKSSSTCHFRCIHTSRFCYSNVDCSNVERNLGEAAFRRNCV